ncbi:phosphopantetheine-binding protein [Sphingomonas sp. IC-56]|jgi:acyl carrier protein|uniref:phosphopantetheine-binding protein n=1 Tax=Sphingomonas sp. IC-56 TaxID=2898529 RepID=UPI001E5ABB4D|nr:phosphopantetheine-binding protein [Sphingomonas sp. IC-56]MCD2323299.1 phosphopantetheine-binding protein [Sphingomonas sp. IC-56]
MEEFLTEMAEILEEDSVDAADELNSFESWDSLATLSVIAMADAQFGVNVTAQELKPAKTVGDLHAIIVAKKAA